MSKLSSLVAVLLWWPVLACCQVSLLRMSGSELDSAGSDSITYTVRAAQPGSLTLEILSADGDVVRSISSPSVQAGEHTIVWDGKDGRAQPVPDEAYCARTTLESAGGKTIDDPCSRTGGEVISGIQTSLSPNGDIVYTLERPGRVLIRVGVKNGAMLRSLAVWRPKPAGRNLQRWNGFDERGIVDLRTNRLALLVTAFRLPDFTVITTGQEGLDYRKWRAAQGWLEKSDTPQGGASQPLERDGQRIARQHYMARYKDKEPRIEVKLSSRDGKPLSSGESVPQQMNVLVDLHPEDRWLLQEQLYEVAFFIDGDFVSEEENGYVPIGWVLDTSRLASGKHLLTVNLTGFSGRVGTHTLLLERR
jgi:FlgD Ig-like domain